MVNKQFGFGFGAASILAVGSYLLVGTGLGTNHQDSQERLQEALDQGQCYTRVSRGSLSGSGRCWSDEVMTGILNNNVYCSRITVRCDGND
jgi:hypothetical protein